MNLNTELIGKKVRMKTGYNVGEEFTFLGFGVKTRCLQTYPDIYTVALLLEFNKIRTE